MTAPDRPWTEVELVRGVYSKGTRPPRRGYVEVRLAWFDDPTKTVEEEAYFDGAEFRATENERLRYEWNVVAWRLVAHTRTRCPNCGDPYDWRADPEFEFRVVHDKATCPFQFDVAKNSLEEVAAEIRRFWYDWRFSKKAPTAATL